jgi:thioredoxin reductase (NADPH)
MTHSQVLIIGSGPAGYTAAIYAARACLKTTLIAGNEIGGQLTTTTDVENYPGFADVIQGPWLMEQMEKQTENSGTRIIKDHIVSVDAKSKPFVLVGESGSKYTTDSMIIATGAQAKWLGIESETKFRGYGISSCATCDGFFYRNKDVLVVGGGNTAVEEALYLAKMTKSVTLIHRRDALRAEKILQKRLFDNLKIQVVWNTVLEEILGQEKPKSVNGAVLKNINDNTISRISIDGIFIAIGHSPNTKLFSKILELDNDGYIITKPGITRTNVPGIFAAGDVQDKTYRQAVTAAGSGCMAALDAEKYLATM